MQICIFLSSFASHYYILKGTISVLMEFHFMYQLVYNHYFKKGIFSSLCALEAKNSKSVPFTELSHLAKFTLVAYTLLLIELTQINDPLQCPQCI